MNLIIMVPILFWGFNKKNWGWLAWLTGMMIRPLKATFWFQFWMTVVFIKRHHYIRNQKLIFLQLFRSIKMKMSCAATTCWFVEAYVKWMSREWYLRERVLLKYYDRTSFNIGLRQDSGELIFLKFGMMLGTATQFDFTWMTLPFSQGHGVTGSWNCCKRQKCTQTSWWLVLYERWLQRCSRSMANMDRLSWCSPCWSKTSNTVRLI